MRAWVLATLLALGLFPEAALAISGGHPATGKEFAFVRFLSIQWPGGQGGSCTGSLIGSRLVLTAGHCVVNDKGEEAVGIDVLKKPSDVRGIPATAFHVHVGYTRREEGGRTRLTKDLAVLVLKDPAPGPYGLTPAEYMWSKRSSATRRDKADALREMETSDPQKMLDQVLARDPDGRPYATQVGFGLFACDRATGKCSKSVATKAKYIEKYLFNYRTDQPLAAPWCDPTPFSLFQADANLICTSAFTPDGTRSPVDEGGPTRIAGPQPGDSGGPAIAFDKDNRAFIIGTLSYGGFGTYDINMNLVENLAFLRDAQVGSGPTIRTVPLKLSPIVRPRTQ